MQKFAQSQLKLTMAQKSRPLFRCDGFLPTVDSICVQICQSAFEFVSVCSHHQRKTK